MSDQTIRITKTENGNRVILAVKGTINTDTSRDLNRALMELNYQDLDLTVDFAETDYITSAGLRALLVARKKLTDERMRIVNANAPVIEVFRTTGFDSLIRLEQAEIDDENFRLSLAMLLRKRAAEEPDRTAYIYRDRAYTWEELYRISHVIADDLSRSGVTKGTHVGICAPNSINWILTLFAVQKLGGIAVLINSALKAEEVAAMTQIGEVTHLCYGIVEGKTSFEAYSRACLDLGITRRTYEISDSIDFSARIGEYGKIRDLYCEKFHADDAAAIIFSSGSTGKPKAILASAYNLTASLEPLIREMRSDREDINLAFLPMYHVFGFGMAVSVGLMCGYTSVIPEGKSPKTIIDLIDRYQCTIFNTVPTMMLAMTQAENFSPEKLRSLRLTIFGGSATTEPQMRMFMQLLPNIHFGNIYGMSENAAVSVTKYVDTLEHTTQTVGRPVAGLELVIRDPATGKILQDGQQGEICIRSNTMVVCYYKLPVEKQPVDDEGWLATGDLGYIDGDGYVRLSGRIKDLIIYGGENISPGEIAEVLAAMPEIADVKVIGIPDPVFGEIIAAAVILKDGAVWNEERVRAEAAAHLAKYKLPAYYAVMDEFPLLGSGKVDVITLKKMVAERAGK